MSAAPALRRATMLATALLATGCATLSPDAGFGPVQQAARDRLGQDLVMARGPADQERIAERVAQLLQRPLAADDAVQLALLNNRGLQARFQDLGIADAERVQASRLPNPGFSFGRLRQGGEVELERGLHFNLAGWLALPLLQPLQAAQTQQRQAELTQAVLALAADARKAWVHAVASAEGVRYAQQVMQAAEASAELARRMAAVGNFNKLQQAREQAFYAQAALDLARAQQAADARREQLTRLLGLWGAQTGYTLPERLPDLPAEPADRPALERQALAQRLDVQAARRDTELTARSLGLTRTTRFINVLALGYQRNTSNEAPTQRGWEVGFELPLFDWGDARTARAESVYMQSLHRAAETAVNARSEVRQAHGQMRSAWDIARHHRDEIVPLRRQIADENLLRYNGMLIGVFELLADARVQIASVNGAIEALRDYWLAQADLEMALVGKAALPAAGPGTTLPAVDAGGH